MGGVDIPVWAIVLGIIGFLVNIIIGLLYWSIGRMMSGIQTSVMALVEADKELVSKFVSVSKELADHRLHVSEHYVKKEEFNSTTAAIFAALREAKDEIVERVQELVRHLEARINVIHKQDNNQTKNKQ